MLRDLVKGAKDKGDSADAHDAGEPQANPLRELQAQYAKMLTRCYELFAEGKRCVHEEDPVRCFDCSRCEYREADHFCRSNFLLKKLVTLVAEHLAHKMIRKGRVRRPEGTADPGGAEEGTPPAPLTQEQVEAFKAKGISYEIETPLCDEHIWLVPERTGNGRLEFTPEEMNFMIQTARTLDGALVEIARGPRPGVERSDG